MNVPVFIQSGEEQVSSLYTKAKLKIFYIGETADHRLFTKEFSEHLVESLPLVPVVGFYSDEEEDFVGHNKTQYVYGIVPESATIEFVEETDENGQPITFAVTDVILYTGRKDNIGEVAQKICGKQHSLELDPDTLKYKINRDSKGKFMNIEFTEGQFVGLSVLGDNETPAFSGSEFFTTNEDFIKVIESSQERFNKFLSLLNNNGGKIEVFNNEAYFTLCASNFVQDTIEEQMQKVYAALDKAGVYGYIQQTGEDFVVVNLYNNQTHMWENYKYALIAEEDGTYSVGDCQLVRCRYYTDEEIEALESPVVPTEDFVEETPVTPEEEEEEEETTTEEFVAATEEVEEDKEEEVEPTAESTKDEEEEEVSRCETTEPVDTGIYSANDTNSETVTEGEITNATASSESDSEDEDETNNEQNDSEEEKQKEEDEVGNATASVSATTLSDSERSELEQYRRAEKLAIISEYAADLDEALIQALQADVDNYSKQDLEAKLAIEFRKAVKSGKQQTVSNTQVQVFSLLSTAEQNYDENNPADVIRRYKNK